MMMELVTASDLFVTASLALLLSFLVAKLVSLAMTETNHHVTGEPVAPVLQAVQTTQTESRVDFITPVQVATTTKVVEETGNDTGDATTVESDSNNVVFESPEKSDIAAVDVMEEKTAAVRDDGDSAEQSRNAECVEEEEEITEEPSTETVVSAMESEAKERDEDEEENDDDDDDDWEWEGIERSELEKVFMSATEFVAVKGCGSDGGGGGGDVQMELYGLHRVAMEGPCREPQPMPLKISARAKWNAWQKLGSMSPEVAMERYVGLLSDKVPGWMKDTSAGMAEHEPPAGSVVSESAASDLSSSFSHQQRIVTEREHEQESGAQDTSPLTESDLENNVKK